MTKKPRDKIKEASSARRRRMRAIEDAGGKFTDGRSMSRLIEDLARTLDDFHYCSRRSPNEVTINFIHGRKMTISIKTTS